LPLNSLSPDLIRFIALDLDGTLLHTDKSISARTRSAVQSAIEKGYQPIIATARPPRGAAILLDGFLSDAPAVYYSGALIVVGGDQILKQTIPCKAALEIVNYFLVACYITRTVFCALRSRLSLAFLFRHCRYCCAFSWMAL